MRTKINERLDAKEWDLIQHNLNTKEIIRLEKEILFLQEQVNRIKTIDDELMFHKKSMKLMVDPTKFKVLGK